MHLNLVELTNWVLVCFMYFGTMYLISVNLLKVLILSYHNVLTINRKKSVEEQQKLCYNNWKKWQNVSKNTLVSFASSCQFLVSCQDIVKFSPNQHARSCHARGKNFGMELGKNSTFGKCGLVVLVVTYITGCFTCTCRCRISSDIIGIILRADIDAASHLWV